jgi:hypothetical protein
MQFPATTYQNNINIVVNIDQMDPAQKIKIDQMDGGGTSINFGSFIASGAEVGIGINGIVDAWATITSLPMCTQYIMYHVFANGSMNNKSTAKIFASSVIFANKMCNA